MIHEVKTNSFSLLKEEVETYCQEHQITFAKWAIEIDLDKNEYIARLEG